MKHKLKESRNVEEYLDEIYRLGIRHGSIDMKNTILSSLNRDWKLFSTKQEIDFMVRILKKINKLFLPKRKK